MNIHVQRNTRRIGLAGWANYATAEEFESLFESKRASLLRLAFLLTASSEKAEQNLGLALQECRLNGSVAIDWILPWARRAIVRSAIQLVLPPVSALAARTPNGDHHDGNSQATTELTSRRVDVQSILKLPEFERLVFVITVLEGSSIQDCALLLARSPKEVRDAQKRAIGIASFLEHDFNVPSQGGAAQVDDPCGKLFEN